MKTKEPKPGDIGFSVINGPLGFFVGLLQFLVGDPNKYSHVFIVLDNGMVAEARRGGIVLTPLEHYSGRAIYTDWGLTDEQRFAVVEHAKQFVGSGYSFLEYLVLAFNRFGKQPGWLLNKVQNSKKYICSQYVMTVYSLAGIDLFEGRTAFTVTPGGLFTRYLERDWL